MRSCAILCADAGQRRDRSARPSESARSSGSGNVRGSGEGSICEAPGLAGAGDQRNQRRHRCEGQPASAAADCDALRGISEHGLGRVTRPSSLARPTSGRSTHRRSGWNTNHGPRCDRNASGSFHAEHDASNQRHHQAGIWHNAEPDLPQRLPELHRRPQSDAADSKSCRRRRPINARR